jgi:hypothetical protein
MTAIRLNDKVVEITVVCHKTFANCGLGAMNRRKERMSFSFPGQTRSLSSAGGFARHSPG